MPFIQQITSFISCQQKIIRSLGQLGPQAQPYPSSLLLLCPYIFYSAVHQLGSIFIYIIFVKSLVSLSMNLFTSLLGNNAQEEVPAKKQKSTDFFFCFHAKQYFDIEEEDIFARIKSAIILTPAFNEVLQSKPDLYGPFWISTTLIVVIVAASSLLHFFNTSSSTTAQTYNFDQISVAASLIYGIAFGCPYILAVLVKIFGGLVSVVDLICIYGYSLTMFLPVTALCFIKSTVIQTALLFVAFLSSTLFLIKGVLSLDNSLGQKEKSVISVFIIGVQVLLVLTYKFYFFDLL